MEDLTLKDCEGIFLKPDCLEFDILAAVAEHALVLYHHQKKNRKEVPYNSSSVSANIEKIPSWYEGCSNSRKKNFYSVKSENCGLKIADNVVSNAVLPNGDSLRGKSSIVIKKKSPIPPRKHTESSTQETKISSRREKDPKGKRPMVYQEESDGDQDYQVPKKKRKPNFSNDVNGNKKNNLNASHGPAIPPPLPQEFKDHLRQLVQDSENPRAAAISDAKLVIQKGLYPTDISKGHNRMLIPIKKIQNEFLTAEEKADLEKYIGANVKSIEVNLIQPSLEVRSVSLRRWAMKKDSGKASISYLISKTWNKIVSNNRLVAGDVVQVWAIRVDGKLWFALVRLPKDYQERSSGSAGFNN